MSESRTYSKKEGARTLERQYYKSMQYIAQINVLLDRLDEIHVELKNIQVLYYRKWH